MKNTLNHLAMILLAGAVLAPSAVMADPAKAEDDAYSMAVYYTQRGFAMAPTNHNGVGGTGTVIRFLIPVTKGLDYVFLVGVDEAALDTDLYVYDEVGSLILDDRRPTKRAGVKFRASYNGTVQVYLHMARANGLASYSVLVGRRTTAFASADTPGQEAAAVEPVEAPKEPAPSQ